MPASLPCGGLSRSGDSILREPPRVLGPRLERRGLANKPQPYRATHDRGAGERPDRYAKHETLPGESALDPPEGRDESPRKLRANGFGEEENSHISKTLRRKSGRQPGRLGNSCLPRPSS